MVAEKRDLEGVFATTMSLKNLSAAPVQYQIKAARMIYHKDWCELLALDLHLSSIVLDSSGNGVDRHHLFFFHEATRAGAMKLHIAI